METIERDPYDDIEERLAKLRRVPPRDNRRFLQGRASFLSQARQFKAQSYDRPANAIAAGVSGRSGQRPLGRISNPRGLTIGNLFRAKERPTMFAPVMTALVVIVLLFGGAGATAYAAQDSLPADALYPVKTLTEDVQLGLSTRDQNRLDLELTFAERRVGEMAAMARLGLDTPLSVANRMGASLEAALTIAAGLEGEAQQDALGQILTRMQAQEQVMAGLEASRPGDSILAQSRQRLQEQLQLAAQGLSDPAGLQEQLQQRARVRAWEVQGPGGPGFGGENGNGNGNGNANGNANGNGNQNLNQNQNQNQNQNGGCDGDNCNGNQNMNQNQNRNQNQNGGCDDSDCDGNQNQNQNGDCDGANCNGNHNGDDDSDGEDNSNGNGSGWGDGDHDDDGANGDNGGSGDDGNDNAGDHDGNDNGGSGDHDGDGDNGGNGGPGGGGGGGGDGSGGNGNGGHGSTGLMALLVYGW